jgi:hypothetical protein
VRTGVGVGGTGWAARVGVGGGGAAGWAGGVVGYGVAGRARVGRGVLEVVPVVAGRTVGVPAVDDWRTAVGALGSRVRARPRVGVARLAAGGSGLLVSRLRGRFTVGVARAGATGATGATGTGASGNLRGTAGGSAISGALKGVWLG